MKKTLILSIISILMLTSCMKDRTPVDATAPATMNQMVVPSNFDWKTAQQYEFTISAEYNGLVEIRSVEGVVFHKINYFAGKNLSLKLSIPTYVKTIQVTHLGRIIEKQLDDNQLDFSFDQ